MISGRNKQTLNAKIELKKGNTMGINNNGVDDRDNGNLNNNNNTLSKTSLSTNLNSLSEKIV